MKRIIVDKISKRFWIGRRKGQGALEKLTYLFSGREPQRKLVAIDRISFAISSGEIVGIVGDNGAGKSTLLRMIAGIYKPDSGRIFLNGKIISLINLGAGFQQRLTMRDNLYLCCSLFGLSLKETKLKFNSIVEFSGLDSFIDTKLYQFSNGMQQRLSFSIAIHCNPDILLLDEVFEVGDESFKKKSAEKILGIVKKGASVILVSHEKKIIKNYSKRILVLKHGRIAQEFSRGSKGFNKLLVDDSVD